MILFWIYLFLLLILIIAGLGKTLTPLLLAFIFAYLFYPLIKHLERWKVRRTVAVGTVLILLFALLTTLLFLILPLLLNEAKIFFIELPKNMDWALLKVQEIVNRFGFSFVIDRTALLPTLESFASLDLLQSVTHFFKGTVRNLAEVLLSILNLFLIPVFFYFVMVDYEKIIESIASLLPFRWHRGAHSVFSQINDVLRGYIRGQLLVAFLLAILYSIGLGMVGLPFGIVIGVSTGLLSIIPIVGCTVGFLISVVTALASGYGFNCVAGVVTIFVMLQIIESYFLTPHLVGKKVGLTQLQGILALIIGGNLGGLIGMLMAIPLAGILKIIFLRLKQQYQNSPLYKY